LPCSPPFRGGCHLVTTVPWEQFVSLLTEGLIERRLDVTLFATADSVTSARLRAVAPTGYSEAPSLDAKVWEAPTYRFSSKKQMSSM
jgi:hypothetical protein